MTVRWYVGWDARDALAFRVFARSLARRSSVPIEVQPICDRILRQAGLYWRTYHTRHSHETNALQMIDDRDGKPFSTAFSFARFGAILMEKHGHERVVISDPDMLCRRDPAELLRFADPDAVVACVKHDHRPRELVKMDGVVQERYYRKNWSSLMVVRPDLCSGMTKYVLNNMDGQYLHALLWADDRAIAGLPEEWNWLEGWSPVGLDPAIVHYTRGTPDFSGHEDSAYAEEWWSYVDRERELAIS